MSVAARLERLPFARFHRRLLMMGGLGYTFDGLDAAVLAFVLPVLRTRWALSSVQTGLLGSGTYIGYFFGALLAGTLGDVIGRRSVMLWALVIYCVASAFSALVDDWPAFFILRIIAGFGTGAESAIVAPFLAEFVAGRYRGRFTGALTGFFSFGFVGAALLSYALLPAFAGAWRVELLITALPIVMLLWWRRALPESPRWLVGRGRAAEAAAILDRIEREIEADGHTLPPPAPEAPAPLARAGRGGILANLAALWSRKLARITAMAWIMWLSITFSFYAFFTWIPGLLVQSGMTITRSFGYSLVIYVAQIPGYLLSAYTNERLGRRATITGGLLLGGLAAMALAASHSDRAIMLGGFALSLFMSAAYGGIYAYTPEVFPTDIRTTGVGTASAIGRLGAIASPILVGAIFPRFGFLGVFGMTTLVLLLGAAAVLLLGLPTTGRTLEEIAAEELGPTAMR